MKAFLCIVPTGHDATVLQERVKELSARFESEAALKLPPHITLVPPLHDQELAVLRDTVRSVCEHFRPFPVVLSQPAVFEQVPALVHLADSAELHRLYSSTMTALLREALRTDNAGLYDALQKYRARRYTPHLTYAKEFSRALITDAKQVQPPAMEFTVGGIAILTKNNSVQSQLYVPFTWT